RKAIFGKFPRIPLPTRSPPGKWTWKTRSKPPIKRNQAWSTFTAGRRERRWRVRHTLRGEKLWNTETHGITRGKNSVSFRVLPCSSFFRGQHSLDPHQLPHGPRLKRSEE